MSRLKYEQCPRCAARGADSRMDNLVHYPDDSFHCFSCGYHISASYKGPKQREFLKETTYGSTLLPADFTREVPPDAWRWLLLNTGLSWNYWQNQGVGYSPSTERLVFPFPGKTCLFSLGRYLGKTPGTPKWKNWGNSHDQTIFLGSGTIPVLVEDLLSAHKVAVAEPRVAVAPLFGTTLHPCVFKALLGRSKPLGEGVLWLDKDQQGMVQKKATRLSLITGYPWRVLHTEKDPKHLTPKEIQELL